KRSADDEARGSQAPRPLEFGKATAPRQAMPATRLQKRIDGKCSTPTVSARSEFTRTLARPFGRNRTSGRSTSDDSLRGVFTNTKHRSDGCKLSPQSIQTRSRAY